jgi:oligopeptide/dipeptide ABC transporter ATP-binding protein
MGERVVPILRTEELCREFIPGGFSQKPVRVVDRVNMEVAPGEIRGIVGESGSGKTTLARCSLRLLEPSSGSVYFDGQDLAALSPAALRDKRQEFQMVFQDPYGSLNPSMTVEEIILEPLRIHRIGSRDSQRQYLQELLEAVSLSEHFLKRRSAELSGGQQQRIGIARGLALKPRLLVADEPVSSLDASVQAQILNLLAELQQKYALTLILISHSLGVIHYLCDKISVMYRGRIVEEAPADSFFRKPKHPYSLLLLHSMPTMHAPSRNDAPPAGSSTASPADSASCCAFHPRCVHAFELCRKQIPPLIEVEEGETVACFLYS